MEPKRDFRWWAIRVAILAWMGVFCALAVWGCSQQADQRSWRDALLGPRPDKMDGGETYHRQTESAKDPQTGDLTFKQTETYAKGPSFEGPNAEDLEGGAAEAGPAGAEAGDLEKEGFEPTAMAGVNPFTYCYYGGIALIVVGIIIAAGLRQVTIGLWVSAAGGVTYVLAIIGDQYPWVALIAVGLVFAGVGWLIYKKMRGDTAAKAEAFLGKVTADLVTSMQEVRGMAKSGDLQNAAGKPALEDIDRALGSKQDAATQEAVKDVKKERNL